jgi:thiol-disulfide isomerase/thioredoxin
MRLQVVAAAVALLACTSGRGNALASGDTPLALGALAPAVSVPTNRGAFDSATSAKPFVLELFAVWCPHCQREVPLLNELERIDGRRADIVAIPASPFSFDHTTMLDAQALQAFVMRFGVGYRVGFDEFYSLSYQYGVAQFPTLFFISADRHVVAVEAGEVPFEQLHADVERLFTPARS